MLRKISFFVVLFILSVNVFGNTTDLKIQQDAVNQEFEQVNLLEKYLSENPNATLESIKAEKPELLENVVTNTEAAVKPMRDMPLLGSFWWGCCLGVIGLALVYFMTDKDRDQVKKALWGCLIATIIWGVGGFLDPFGWF